MAESPISESPLQNQRALTVFCYVHGRPHPRDRGYTCISHPLLIVPLIHAYHWPVRPAEAHISYPLWVRVAFLLSVMNFGLFAFAHAHSHKSECLSGSAALALALYFHFIQFYSKYYSTFYS